MLLVAKRSDWLLADMLLPLILFAPVMIFVMFSDLRWMRIPNWTALTGVALFLAALPWMGWDEAISRAVVASIVFAIGFGLFAVRILAGGDVKFLAALVLMLPPASLSLFGFVFSFAMLASIGVLTAARATVPAGLSRWVGMRARQHMPMGVAMGLAGLLHLAILTMNNFPMLA